VKPPRPRPTARSLSTPITLTSVAVALSLGLLVGWSVLIVDTLWSGRTWLLVLGIVSIAFITTVLLMSGISLARQILEGRRQQTFVDSVTHELKSPLASLGLCLETLNRADLSEAQRRDVRAMMRQDVERLSAFIDDVLTASRLAHGGVRNLDAFVPVRLFDLASRARQRALARHERDEDELTLDIPQALSAKTDPTALETVLKNLIDNALKYSGRPARVTIQAAVVGDRVRIAVSDAGIGIAPDDLPRIFRRFYRGDSEEVRARSGTGLGLFVASELARGLGGRLEVSSPGPGQGATFTLDLPHRP
jgi:signal transduction histidine kinase